MRLIISHYLKDCYKLKSLAIENAKDSISIDESLFSHENNQQIWVVGLINNRTHVIRMEIVNNRTNNTIKKYLYFLLKKEIY